MTTKRCSKCGQTKDISEFYELKYNSITMKDGTIKWIGPQYEAHCKKCESKAQKNRYNKKHGFKQFLKNTHKTKNTNSQTQLTKTERQTWRNIKYAFESPIGNLKKCSICGEYQPLKNYYKEKRTKEKRRTICKTCQSRIRKEKYVYVRGPQKNYTTQEKRIRKNEELKKYFKTYGRMLRHLSGNGCCLYCGETNPFMLNNHHIFGRKNSDFTITLCENHHAAFTRHLPFVLEKWYASTINKRTNRSA